jgi:hypothetical protein
MKLSAAVSCCTCKRLKSSTSFDRAKEAILRVRRENRLLFGKLLESSTAKRKRLEKSSSKNDSSYGDSSSDQINASKTTMEVEPLYRGENESKKKESANDELPRIRNNVSSSNHPLVDLSTTTTGENSTESRLTLDT